jgi:hypothetical protein
MKLVYMVIVPSAHRSSGMAQFAAYMIVVFLFCFTIALMGGSAAVLASLKFNKMIYKQVR